MELSQFPTLNASLNALSGIFLGLGFFFIRRRVIKAHVICMLSACATSVLFLACYLYYHYHHGSTPFQGQGLIRIFYFTILLSHTILAMVIVPMIIITLRHGLKARFVKHVKIARITWPLWVYVSVTGVVIYVMLYHWKP